MGIIIDIDGVYFINVKGEDVIFVVSYIGFEMMEVEVGNQIVLDIIMIEGVNFQEVVVVVFGIECQEKVFGYFVQEVLGVELVEIKEVNVVNFFNGKVVGIQIQGVFFLLGGFFCIIIWGFNFFFGDNQLLFVVDGILLDNFNFVINDQMCGFGGGMAYDYGNIIQDIDFESIESMMVLKGVVVFVFYGQCGVNGVILIIIKDGFGCKGKGIGVEVNLSMMFDQVNNFIFYQQEYGGGVLNIGILYGFNIVIQDGQEYFYFFYLKDGLWGLKYDFNCLVCYWDSWDLGSLLYKEVCLWVVFNFGYEDFFEIGQMLQNSIVFSGVND